MSHSDLSKEFIESQRESLEKTKVELERMRDGLQEDEQDRADGQVHGEADAGDLSQNIHTRQLDQTISEQTDTRIENVELALRKIEDGTYGICEDTGEEIPKGRLEAIPEAVTTVEAQQRRDERSGPGRTGGSL